MSTRTALPYPPPPGVTPNADTGSVTLTAAELAEATGLDRTDAPAAVSERLLQVAARMVLDYAPQAPTVLLNEAVIRFGGYLAQSDFGGVRSESLGPRFCRVQPEPRRGVPQLRRRRPADPLQAAPRRRHRLTWPCAGPWSRPEARQSGGDFSDAVVRLIESQAAGKAADSGSTAAVEAAAGALSRALATAEVTGPDWATAAVSPTFLGQVGRDLIRSGDSLHVIRVRGGRLRLIPASSWHFEGDHDPDTWTVRATAYGPSSSTTWHLSAAGVVFVRWGGTPGQPYVGTGPTSWAHTTARLGSEAERSLADEAAGPLAHLLPVPQDGGDPDDDTDTFAGLRADIKAARGKALLVQTTAAGWDEGRASAPQADWKPNRLGPQPPATMPEVARDAFARTLAACGTPVSMFTDADGTAQREALRRWHMGTVVPLARLLQHELRDKLEADVRLKFDPYPLDVQGRAAAFAKLVTGGVEIAEALRASGLLDGE